MVWESVCVVNIIIIDKNNIMVWESVCVLSIIIDKNNMVWESVCVASIDKNNMVWEFVCVASIDKNNMVWESVCVVSMIRTIWYGNLSVWWILSLQSDSMIHVTWYNSMYTQTDRQTHDRFMLKLNPISILYTTIISSQ